MSCAKICRTLGIQVQNQSQSSENRDSFIFGMIEKRVLEKTLVYNEDQVSTLT